jgi:hypothetical protein
MARKPGNISPDSGAGNARLTIGRSGSNSGRYQTPRVANAKLNAIKNAMSKAKPARPTVDSIIGTYKGFKNPTLAQKKIFGSVNFKAKPLPKSIKPLNSYNSTTSNNYAVPVGLGIIGGAAVIGSNAAKNRARQEAIKRASVKTRKGQSRGR